ncbi:hypothetical protein AB0F13_00935 [Streptomyces sp. NPDC026206]|uniref:hypothetical protein n=1 Tax=Streptomyces sp. NPDC026206 TaxID=3157089 RepID=UPI0033ECE149
MGFWGYLLLGRGGDRALTEFPVLAASREHLVPARAFAGGWQLWRHPDYPDYQEHLHCLCFPQCPPHRDRPSGPEPAGAMDAQVRALACETGAPALAAYVMESDCAIVAGAHPGGASWSACLGRTPLAQYMADTGLGLDELFPTPREAAAHCAAWAAAAGHTADAAELAQVLAADPEPLVEDLFEELLARLGVVERRLAGR